MSYRRMMMRSVLRRPLQPARGVAFPDPYRGLQAEIQRRSPPPSSSFHIPGPRRPKTGCGCCQGRFASTQIDCITSASVSLLVNRPHKEKPPGIRSTSPKRRSEIRFRRCRFRRGISTVDRSAAPLRSKLRDWPLMNECRARIVCLDHAMRVQNRIVGAYGRFKSSSISD